MLADLPNRGRAVTRSTLTALSPSKRAYEFSYFYADALYYGGGAESIPAYIVVARLRPGQQVPARGRCRSCKASKKSSTR